MAGAHRPTHETFPFLGTDAVPGIPEELLEAVIVYLGRLWVGVAFHVFRILSHSCSGKPNLEPVPALRIALRDSCPASLLAVGQFWSRFIGRYSRILPAHANSGEFASFSVV